MIIEINPLDVLFFRDSKPFNRTEDSWANSLSFPNLTTIYGALRTSHFGCHMEQLKYANRANDPTRGLEIKNAALSFDNLICYATPADLSCYKERNKLFFKYSELVKNEMSSSLSLKTGLTYSVKKEIHHDYYKEASKVMIRLSKFDLENYFDNDEIEGIDLGNSIYEESKIGIGRNDLSKTSEDGLLYRIGQIRYQDNLKIIVEINDGIIDIPESGVFQMGGQGKAVSYRILQNNTFLKVDESQSKEKCNRLKIYMKSPAVFRNGWKPDFLNEGKNMLEGIVDGKRVRLIGACIDGYNLVGGYDIESNRAKPLVRCVPAGSIYYMELLEPVEETRIKELNFPCHYQDSTYTKCGFGQAFGIFYWEE